MSVELDLTLYRKNIDSGYLRTRYWEKEESKEN
jgi:hypothetical protein